ncbi:CCR4-NOT transcription complex subunit 9 protein [Dioscorea alata]|uniref:CCR4-NOT transcription complex subunit 9 protein n=1 Tax=Dioscorea alata TaxID=55571 RepID=A0ACB7VI70_DIOAL|nr:CCR4-NOT transcription complex subunit 9 protein [Dioscorea alata]
MFPLQVDDDDVVAILLQMEIIPLCMHNMDFASPLAKELATYIVIRILVHDIGLEYICSQADRFFALCAALQRMVVTLTQKPSTKFLRKIICCYLRLADHPRACRALHGNLPVVLRNGTFDHYLTMLDDQETWSLIQQLILKVS